MLVSEASLSSVMKNSQWNHSENRNWQIHIYCSGQTLMAMFVTKIKCYERFSWFSRWIMSENRQKSYISQFNEIARELCWKMCLRDNIYFHWCDWGKIKPQAIDVWKIFFLSLCVFLLALLLRSLCQNSHLCGYWMWKFRRFCSHHRKTQTISSKLVCYSIWT